MHANTNVCTIGVECMCRHVFAAVMLLDVHSARDGGPVRSLLMLTARVSRCDRLCTPHHRQSRAARRAIVSPHRVARVRRAMRARCAPRGIVGSVTRCITWGQSLRRERAACLDRPRGASSAAAGAIVRVARRCVAL